jgi:hypothetical protein
VRAKISAAQSFQYCMQKEYSMIAKGAAGYSNVPGQPRINTVEIGRFTKDASQLANEWQLGEDVPRLS